MHCRPIEEPARGLCDRHLLDHAVCAHGHEQHNRTVEPLLERLGRVDRINVRQHLWRHHDLLIGTLREAGRRRKQERRGRSNGEPESCAHGAGSYRSHDGLSIEPQVL
jgi:hypothetical protein